MRNEETKVKLPKCLSPFLKEKIMSILDDPTISFWLKNAIIESLDRDCIDALYDAEALYLIMKAIVKEHQNLP